MVFLLAFSQLTENETIQWIGGQAWTGRDSRLDWAILDGAVVCYYRNRRDVIDVDGSKKGWRMDTAVADVPRWRFSTDDLPECERGAALDAVYGRNTVVAYEALPDAHVYAGFTQRRRLRRCVSNELAGISPTALWTCVSL
jgi:hypothetical protein